MAMDLMIDFVWCSRVSSFECRESTFEGLGRKRSGKEVKSTEGLSKRV